MIALNVVGDFQLAALTSDNHPPRIYLGVPVPGRMKN
jgi:hypothetical protein